MERRVVVTGIGMIAPTGNPVETAWKNVCEGRSGVGRITRFDASALQTQIAGEVKGFNAEDYIDKKDARRMDKFSIYALVAALEAMERSVQSERWEYLLV